MLIFETGRGSNIVFRNKSKSFKHILEKVLDEHASATAHRFEFTLQRVMVSKV